MRKVEDEAHRRELAQLCDGVVGAAGGGVGAREAVDDARIIGPQRARGLELSDGERVVAGLRRSDGLAHERQLRRLGAQCDAQETKHGDGQRDQAAAGETDFGRAVGRARELNQPVVFGAEHVGTTFYCTRDAKAVDCCYSLGRNAYTNYAPSLTGENF